MVEVVLTGAKKLAKLPATLTLENGLARLTVSVGGTDMVDEATLLKRFKEYGLVTEPKKPEATIPVSAPEVSTVSASEAPTASA